MALLYFILRLRLTVDSNLMNAKNSGATRHCKLKNCFPSKSPFSIPSFCKYLGSKHKGSGSNKDMTWAFVTFV